MSQYNGDKGLEYYKAYPRDFFEGVVGMSGPLRGFYRMVLDLIYMHDGFLLEDWGHISGHTGFGKTQCRRMMQELIERGKIEIEHGNERYFTQKRAKNELKVSKKYQKKQANNALARWKNNDLDDAVGVPTHMPPQDHKTTIQKKEANASKEKTTKRRSPSRALPEDFVPDLDKAASLKDELELNRFEMNFCWQRFKDHALATDRRQVDWDRAFASWVRKAAHDGEVGPKSKSRRTSTNQSNFDL